MQCLGLTIERRRCAIEAVGATGYCEQHQPYLMQDQQAIAVSQDRGVAAVLHRLCGNPSRHLIPDDAKFAVPSWLRKSPTRTVIHHLLHDADSMARWHAAFTLRKRRDPQAIEPLWEALQHDLIALVRQQSAVALGKIGTMAVLSPLIEALWHDRDPAVRQACAIALGNLGYAIAARDLANVLEREQAVFVRWDCVLALGQVGDLSVEPLLAQMTNGERTQVVRHACAEALMEIRRRGQ